MSIIGITHDRDGRTIQRLAVDIKLAIGLPPDPSKGRKAPTKLDQFVFLRKPAEAKDGTDWKIDANLTKFYGPKCRAVEIILLSDDIEEVFPTMLAWWKASHCVCSGDGINAIRRTKEFPQGQKWSPCREDGCEDFKRKDCKPSGDLRFTLAAFPQLGSVARIHTSSYRSIMQIGSALHQVQLITGGRLAGIRATLTVRPEKTSYADPTGKMHSTTIFALAIEIQAPKMSQLLEGMTEHARLFEQTKKLLGAGHIQVIEGEDRSKEITEEFYHSDRGEYPAPPRRTVETVDVSTIIPSLEPNRGHNDTGLERTPSFDGVGTAQEDVDLNKVFGPPGAPTEAKAPEKKPEVVLPVMCSFCGQIGSHAEDCEVAKKEYEALKAKLAEKEPPKVPEAKFTRACYIISDGEKKKTKEGEPYVVLSVTPIVEGKKGDPGKVYVWKEPLLPIFGGRKFVDDVAIVEISQGDKKGKKFIEVEHVIEIAGQAYVDDKLATVMEAGKTIEPKIPSGSEGGELFS